MWHAWQLKRLQTRIPACLQILEQPYVQQHMQRWLQEQEQRVLSSTVQAPRVRREVKRSLSRMASDKVSQPVPASAVLCACQFAQSPGHLHVGLML